MKWREYYWWMIIGFAIMAMAIIEARVRFFVILGGILIFLGFILWVRDEMGVKKDVDRRKGKPKIR